MPLLSRPLQLHDVQDVEAHIVSVISSSTHVASLRPHEREDLAAYLIATAWELSLIFDPALGRVTFSSYLGTTVRLRVIDWVRKERGRSKWSWSNGTTYERERPRMVSLDADDSIRDRLDAALSAGSGDPETGRDPAFAGLDKNRDRQRARDHETLGLTPHR